MPMLTLFFKARMPAETLMTGLVAGGFLPVLSFTISLCTFSKAQTPAAYTIGWPSPRLSQICVQRRAVKRSFGFGEGEDLLLAMVGGKFRRLNGAESDHLQKP